MVNEYQWHSAIGDHRFVAIPTATTEVTFNFASSLTSSSDSATEKYFDNLAKSVIQFDLVADQDIQLTKLNGTTLTDAIPIDGNKSYGEKEGNYNSVTVKTTADNTSISMRAR